MSLRFQNIFEDMLMGMYETYNASFQTMYSNGFDTVHIHNNF
jgi:hypothetical protein